MIFVCDMVEGDVLNPGEPLTYDYYQEEQDMIAMMMCDDCHSRCAVAG